MNRASPRQRRFPPPSRARLSSILRRDETKRLRFDVAQGGLYRVETLGRMKTALRVGANVSPRLGEGEANGPGDNALVTAFLRAGAYRAAVTAKESSGHLGLAVSPATLAPTAKLVDAGIARATLDSGKGAIVPIEITRDGRISHRASRPEAEMAREIGGRRRLAARGAGRNAATDAAVRERRLSAGRHAERRRSAHGRRD